MGVMFNVIGNGLGIRMEITVELRGRGRNDEVDDFKTN